MPRLTGDYLSDMLATPDLTQAQQADIVVRYLVAFAARYPGKNLRLPAVAVAALAQVLAPATPETQPVAD